MNIPQSTLGRALVPDLDRVFRRFPLAAGLIVALLVGLILTDREAPRFRFAEPPYVGLLWYDEAVIYGALAVIFVAVAVSGWLSLSRQIGIVTVAALVFAGLVQASYGSQVLSRAVGFEAWHLLVAAFLLALVGIGTAQDGDAANRNRRIGTALIALPIAFLLSALIIGACNLFLTGARHRNPFWIGAFDRPVQAIYLAVGLFYWLAWLSETDANRDQQGPLHAVLRRLGIPLLLVVFGVLSLFAFGVTATWTGLGTSQGKPDFPLELSNPVLCALVAATLAIAADRQRFGQSAETFLRFAPAIIASFALFHAAALFQQLHHLITGTQALHTSVYAQMVVGVAVAIAGVLAWRMPGRDVRVVLAPLAAAFLFLCAGPWGILSFQKVRLVDIGPWARPVPRLDVPTAETTELVAARKRAAEAKQAADNKQAAAQTARLEEARRRQTATLHAAFHAPMQLDVAGYARMIGPMTIQAHFEIPVPMRLSDVRFGGVIFDVDVDPALRLTIKSRVTGAAASYDLKPQFDLLIDDATAVRAGAPNQRRSPRWTGQAPILRAIDPTGEKPPGATLPADLAVSHMQVTSLDGRVIGFGLTISLLVRPGASDAHFTAPPPEGPPPFGSPSPQDLLLLPNRIRPNW